MSIRMNDRIEAQFVDTETVYTPRNLMPGDVVVMDVRDRDGNFYGHRLRLVTEDGIYCLQTGRRRASLEDYTPPYFKLKPGVL